MRSAGSSMENPTLNNKTSMQILFSTKYLSFVQNHWKDLIIYLVYYFLKTELHIIFNELA